MANIDTGIDILGYILRRAGDILPTDATGTPALIGADHYIDAKLHINQAYFDICGMRRWKWARKATQFVSIAEVTGTVNTIVGATVTMSAVVTPSMAGRKFCLDSEGIPVRISAHTSGTNTLTLSNSYTGIETSGAYTIFQDEVTVATDILGFPDIVELHTGDNILVVPEAWLLQESPRNILGSTKAQYASFISNTQVRLVPWTESARLFECRYNYRPSVLDFGGSAADTPIVPQEHRVAIAKLALSYLYKDKRDQRFEHAEKEAAGAIQQMTTIESTFSKFRFRPTRGARVS